MYKNCNTTNTTTTTTTTQTNVGIMGHIDNNTTTTSENNTISTSRSSQSLVYGCSVTYNGYQCIHV